MSKKAHRLFEEFKPEHYDLKLRPDKQSLTFNGQIVLNGLKTGRPSKRITLHQKDLKITGAKLIKHDKKQGKQPVNITRIVQHKAYDEVRLHADNLLYSGKYTIELAFEGIITKDMQGMYPCYFQKDGKTKIILGTQFESHHAREVFPCIDEPEAKATFQLSLDLPKGETVLSNTPIATQKTNGTFISTTFQPTPRMSTYLLAFVAGDMHCAEAKTKHGTVVRSWSSTAQPKNHLDYSVKEAVAVLEFFTDYFGIPYPLEKCDQVALPDFDAGAMENWGLITYREIALLADPDNPSISSEQYVSLVVAHELSHQWFGNLVTMKWWDDLWLNESFASIMEHTALNAIHPEWQQWERYTAMDVISTSARDVYSNIQPVGVKVTDPDLIETLFDPGIVYAKGGRLIKMMIEYIGDDAFRTGLKAYFKKHAYGNATRADLWDALSQASGKDISTLMTPWIEQPGMPVVQASQNNKILNLIQSRFTLDQASSDTTWPIPLLANTQTTPDILIKQSGNSQLANSDYVLLNQYGSGHYFVHYQDQMHRNYLAAQIQKQSVPTEARINILNDMYMLARRGDAPLTDALDIAAQCASEPRDSVWGVITRVIGAASQLTEGDDTTEVQIKQLKKMLAHSWHKKLGWDDATTDDANTKQLRHTAIALMIASEDNSTIQEALKRFNKAKDIADLPAETRALLLGTAVRHGKPSVIDTLLSAYSNATPDLQLDITSALANTKDPKVASKVLAKALGPKGFVRAQDVMRWLAIHVRNRWVRDVAWQFMVDNWQWIHATLERSKSFDFLPVYCAGVISTDAWAKKYEEFFADKTDIKVLQQNIEVGRADIQARVAWRKRDEAKIKTWLTSFSR